MNFRSPPGHSPSSGGLIHPGVDPNLSTTTMGPTSNMHTFVLELGPHPHHSQSSKRSGGVVGSSVSKGGGGGGEGGNILSSPSASSSSSNAKGASGFEESHQHEGTTTTAGGSDGQKNSTQKRNSVVCTNCRKAHAACSLERPCARCVRMGKQDSCSDALQQKRGPKRRKHIEQDSMGSSTMMITTATSASAINTTPHSGDFLSPNFTFSSAPRGPKIDLPPCNFVLSPEPYSTTSSSHPAAAAVPTASPSSASALPAFSSRQSFSGPPQFMQPPSPTIISPSASSSSSLSPPSSSQQSSPPQKSQKSPQQRQSSSFSTSRRRTWSPRQDKSTHSAQTLDFLSPFRELSMKEEATYAPAASSSASSSSSSTSDPLCFAPDSSSSSFVHPPPPPYSSSSAFSRNKMEFSALGAATLVMSNINHSLMEQQQQQQQQQQMQTGQTPLIEVENSSSLSDDSYDFELDLRNPGLGSRRVPVASLLLLARPPDDNAASHSSNSASSNEEHKDDETIVTVPTSSSSASSPATQPVSTSSSPSQSSPPPIESLVSLSSIDTDLCSELHPSVDDAVRETYKIQIESILATWKHLCPKVGVTVMLDPNPAEARIHHWNHWVKEVWGWSEDNTYSWYDLVHPSEYFRLCRRIHFGMTTRSVNHVACNYVSVPHTFPRPQRLVDRTLDVLNTPTSSPVGLNAVECIRRAKEEEKDSPLFEFYHESFPVRSPTYPYKLLYAISLIYFM